MKYIKKYGILFAIVFAFFMFYKPIICMLMIGSFISFYGIHYYKFLININQNGIESVGKILQYKRDDEGYKTPIVKFETKEGLEIETEPYYYASTDLSKFRTYNKNINKTVTVIYEPNKPKRFIIKSESNFNYISLLFMSLGGIIFLIVAITNLLGYIEIKF